MYTKFSS